MYLLFVDNSYIESEEDGNLSSLGGFIIKDDDYFILRSKFEDIKLSHGLTPMNPIKWNPGEDDKRFARQREVKNQSQLKDDVLKIVGQADLKIVSAFIVGQLDRKTIKQHGATKADIKSIRLNYEKQAVEYLAQRLQMELQDINRSTNGSQRGLIVIECPSTEQVSYLVEHFNHVWHVGSGVGSFNIRFSLLMDGLMYSHDFGCDGIQIADFIVGAMRNSIMKSNYRYLDHFENKIRRWKGKVKGCGVVVYPSNSIKIDKFISRIEASS